MFNSFPVNLDLELLVVGTKEPYISIATEDSGNVWIASPFEPCLIMEVSAGWPGGINAVSWVAVKMRQESMASLLQFCKYTVRRFRSADNTGFGASKVLERASLVEHECSIHLRPGNKEELFFVICCEKIEAFMQK
jgi:hypothetical protein